VVCNFDEGDSGTFADRMIGEGDPFALIEGMTICGIGVGATKGYVYCRSEYPHAGKTFTEAVRIAREAGFLGPNILGSGHAFEIELRMGLAPMSAAKRLPCSKAWKASAESCAPNRLCRRIKGLFGRPTVINNVLSLVAVPTVLDRGADFYAGFGFGRSRGTMPIQIAGNVRYGGLYETAFGLTLGEIVDTIGGGTRSGRPCGRFNAAARSAPISPGLCSIRLLIMRLSPRANGLIGHGGIVIFDDTVDMAQMARFAMEFCAIESCGKCTPCRIGSIRGVEVVDHVLAGVKPAEIWRSSKTFAIR